MNLVLHLQGGGDGLHRRAARGLVAGLVVVGLAAGCGGRSADPGATAASAGTSSEDLAVLRARVQDRLGAASAVQRAVLGDGHVSRGEADRAAADVVLCAADQGLTVVAEWDAPTQTMGFRFANDVANARSIYEDCWRERFQLVGESLAIQAALTPTEAERLERQMIECLRAEGVELSSWPGATPEEPSALEAEGRCYDRAIAGVRRG